MFAKALASAMTFFIRWQRFLSYYKVTLEDEYKPKDDNEREEYYISLLERIVERFATDAFRRMEEDADFEALLTEDEHRKLCGMKEVASVQEIQAYFFLH